MRRGRIARVAVVGCLAVVSTAHDVITTRITFSREISRVLYARCAGCHRENGSAFPLLTYQQARPWAAAIKEEVLERRMPPWGAVKGFGQFRDDRGLTQEEISLIAEWVEGGAPEGDPALLPAAPAPPVKAAPLPATTEIAVTGARTLPSAVVLAGIRASGVDQGASLKVVAQRPDGSLEPLLWLYQFHPRFARSYWYQSPLRFPAGTKIEVSPAATVVLLVRR